MWYNKLKNNISAIRGYGYPERHADRKGLMFMKRRKGSLLQRMMAVLLSAVLVAGMVWDAAPASVLAQENAGSPEEDEPRGGGEEAGVIEEGTGTKPAEETPGSAEEEKEPAEKMNSKEQGPDAEEYFAAEPVMTGWHFEEDAVYPQGNLFYEEGVYRLVLAGGSSEVQILFEEIVSLLPTSVTVELTYPVSDYTGQESAEVRYNEQAVPVTGWCCSEYVRDAEGLLPYRGSFFFLARLGDEAAGSFGEGTARIGVEVVFDEPMTLEAVTAAPGTITSDQTWGEQTLQAGTYTINPGVTVTLTGRLTVNGNVTINGGGTIVRDAGYIGETAVGKASLFYVSSGTLTLENITVDGNFVNSNGPAIYTVGGTVNLQNGAIIQNNKNMHTGGTGKYAGGAVYCEGTLNIDSGTIQNCSTREGGSGFSHAGGGIYLKGTCNMTAGSITGNRGSNGGGIYLASSGAKLNLTGGTISGNSAERYGNGIYYSTVYDADSSLSISGNTNVADVIYLDNSTGVICPKITSELKYPISLACSSKTEGRALAQGEGYTLTVADAAKVSMMDTSLHSKLDSASNSIVLRVVHQHSVTGGSGKQEVFTELDENEVRLTSGSYYLTGDVSLDHSLTVAKGEVVNLCLNGHKLEYAGSDAVSVIVVELDGVLNICDCDGAHGSHTFTSPATNQSVTITGGLITRSTPVDAVGSGICVNGGGTCNFYGGSVAGISDTGTSSISGSHGAVRVEGVFHMYGGAITHNRSGCGGGVNVCSMYGRDASFYLHGGSISYNYADYDDGGGICLNGECSFEMTGGEIRGNRAKSGGGAIHCYGNGNNTDAVRLTGGTITGNTTGGGVGGGIYCENTERPLNVSGTIRITGNTNASGKESNLYLCSRKMVNIEGGLSSGAAIGITAETSPTAGNPVVITGTNAADFSRYFSSDLSAYMIADGAGHQVQLVNKPTDAEKAAEAKKVVEQVLSGLTVDNSTTKDSIQQEIDEALRAAGIGSDVTVNVTNFTKTEATSSAAGIVGGTVSVTRGSASENVTINKPIAKLPKTDAEKVADAKKVVEQVLSGLTVDNSTTKDSIQQKINEALRAAGIGSDVTVNVTNFTKTEATSSAAGIVGGTVSVTRGSASENVTINKPIAKLPKTDAEKVADAKRIVDQVLSGLTANNNTTKEQIQNQINEALSAAGIGSDVSVSVEDFEKTEATSSAAGSIGGTVSVTSGSTSENVTINKPIAKLSGTGEEGGNSGSTEGGNSGSSNNNNGNGGGSNNSGNHSGSNDNGGSGNHNDGSANSGTDTPVNAPVTVIIMPPEELENAVLTETEKQQKAADGADIQIELEVEVVAAGASAADRALVEEVLHDSASGYTIGQYLDINLYKVIGNSRTAIKETDGKITIRIDVPDSLKNTEGGRTRTYAVIRVHDGGVEFLSDLDNDADTITIATDRFSTYAVVYQDTAAEADTGKTDSEKDNEPKTGDTVPLELYATLAMIAGFAYLLLYFADRERGMTEEMKKEIVSRLVGWAKQGGRIRKYLALAAIFVLLVYYHSIGKKTSAEWKVIYGE